MTACLIRTRKLEESKRGKKAQASQKSVFCNLISGEFSHQLYHILSIRSKSQVQATLKERKSHRDVTSRQSRSSRAILEVCYHRHLLNKIEKCSAIVHQIYLCLILFPILPGFHFLAHQITDAFPKVTKVLLILFTLFVIAPVFFRFNNFY